MTDVPWRVAALVPLPAEAVRAFTGDLPVEIVVPDERTPEAARVAAGDADVVLGDFSGALRVDAGLVASARRLAFVQQPTVGVDAVDLDACAAAGVPVANTAGANAVSVAEWAVMAAAAVSRSAVWADAEVRAGRWPQLELAARGCLDLAGRRVGVVGFGAVGEAAARRFVAFDCPVAYWTRTRRDGDDRYRDLDELVATSDVLVVDVGRGGIVDHGALLELLDAGHLSGAALDVYDEEPLAAGSPLRAHDRVLLSPHAAGATLQARLRIVAAVTANLRRALGGEPVLDVRNGVDPLVRRRTATGQP